MFANTHKSLGLPQFAAQVKRISTPTTAHNPRDQGVFQFALNTRPSQNLRHSRGRGRFSGRNVHPESTTTPSFPRTRESRYQQSTPFHPIPGNNHRPFRSQGMYESLTRNHWRSAARVLQMVSEYTNAERTRCHSPRQRSSPISGKPPQSLIRSVKNSPHFINFS